MVDDSISPGEIQQIVSGLSLGLLAIIVAALLDLRYRTDNRSHSTPIFAAIGLADIAVDVLTASRYFQGPTYADFPTERVSWGGIFVATLVMPVIGNIIILARFLRREGRASPPFLEWMNNHMGKLRPVFFLTSLKYGSIRLIHCRVAGLEFLSAPVSRRTINKLRTYGTITAVVQDIPQLALVIYVVIKTDKSTWLTGAKLGLSALTLLMAVVGLVVGLIAVRMSNRDDDAILGGDEDDAGALLEEAQGEPERRRRISCCCWCCWWWSSLGGGAARPKRRGSLHEDLLGDVRLSQRNLLESSPAEAPSPSLPKEKDRSMSFPG